MSTRNNIILPPSSVDESDQLFDVTFSELDGDLVVRRHRPPTLRHRLSQADDFIPVVGIEAPWVESLEPVPIPGRSRATCRVARFSRRYDLRTHATLKFDNEPTLRRSRQCLSAFLRGLTQEIGRIPYVGVPERGAVARRLHWHVLLPADLDAEMLLYYWPYGDPRIEHGQTCDDLDGLIRYVTKTFRDPDYERDFRSRYSIARGFPTAREIRRGLVQSEVDALLSNLTVTRENTIRLLDRPNPFVEYYVTWAPKHIPLMPDNMDKPT